VNGVLVLDKPAGPTSFDMVARVRRAAAERRVGHAGTLDPMATGVLVLCLGEATKLVPYLQDADKEYHATLRLGVTTDTDDAGEGARVLARADEAALRALTPEAVRAAFAVFVGQVGQRPPRYSALKTEGVRLYERARRGEALDQEIADKERPVQIHEIEVEEIDLPQVTFRVRCGKGTYIRSLGRDVGERLGVGGHLSALRRLRVGRFTLADATPLTGDRFAAPPRLFTPREALAHLQAVQVSREVAARVRQGQRAVLPAIGEMLQANHGAPEEGQAAAVLEAEALAAVLVWRQGAWTIGRVFVETE
jgi:tRNA pseudouridine55 synthase